MKKIPLLGPLQLERKELVEVRDQLLNNLKWPILVFGSLAAVLAAYLAIQQNDTVFGVIYLGAFFLILFSLVLKKRISATVQAIIFMAAMYTVSLAVFCRTGLSGPGLIFFLGTSVLSSTFFGLRAGLFTSFLCLVSLLGVGFGMIAGWINIHKTVDDLLRSPLAWTISGTVFLLISVCWIMIRQMFTNRLIQSLELIEDKSKKLEINNYQLFQEIQARELAQKALKESEALLKATFESTRDGVLVVSTPGEVSHFNTGFRKLLSIPEQVFSSKKEQALIDFVLPQLENPDHFADEIKKIYQTSQDTFHVIPFKDGRFLERYSAPLVHSGKSQGRVWFFKDVTDQKKAEDAVQNRVEELAVLNNLMRTINSKLSLSDVIASATKQLGILLKADVTMLFLREGDALVLKGQFSRSDVSPPALDKPHRIEECLCGLSVSQNSSLFSANIHLDSRCNWDECKAAGLRSVFVSPLNAAQENIGVLYIGFLKEKVLNEQSVFLETLTQEVAIAVKNALLYQEVQKYSQELEIRLSQIKDTEKSLAQSMNLFQTVFEFNPNPSAIRGLTDGKYRKVNRAFEEVHGYSQEEIKGRTPVEIGLYSEKDFFQLSEKIESEHQFSNHKVVVKAQNGNHQTLLVAVRQIDLNGEPCSISNAIDITEIVNLERQLRHSQKMEAIGTLAGGIAHDFNNILTIILGNAQLARKSIPEGSNQYEYLKSILKAGERATDLVNHILTFSRKSEKTKSPIDIVPIIKETLKLLRASIPKSIELHTHIQETGEKILGAPSEIHQILLNLCTNAFQSMGPEGGLLTIQLEKVTLYPKDPGTSEEGLPSDFLRLQVSDTGSGIDPSIREKIFDPYFTTKKIGQGTGLGLAIVQGIVKEYGGKIRMFSAVGEGSVFCIDFPVTRITKPQAVSYLEKAAPGSDAILLVDDEGAIAKMTSEMLQELGYKVDAYTSSLEALAALKACPGSYDLVITDQTMPQMSGFHLAQEILSVRPETPIILCTGFSETITPEKVKEAGIKELHMKPLSLFKLAQSIRSILDNDPHYQEKISRYRPD